MPSKRPTPGRRRPRKTSTIPHLTEAEVRRYQSNSRLKGKYLGTLQERVQYLLEKLRAAGLVDTHPGIWSTAVELAAEAYYYETARPPYCQRTYVVQPPHRAIPRTRDPEVRTAGAAGAREGSDE